MPCYKALQRILSMEYYAGRAEGRRSPYATDIVFKHQYDLKTIYEQISRTMIHAVKPENIATFLGRKMHGNYQDEMGNNFNTHIEGIR